MLSTQPSRARSGSLQSEIDRARHLLEPAEHELPDGVVDTVRFFTKHALWFRLSRNPPVFSCRDAARRRYRLGYIGIPLADELRSYLAEALNESGKKIYILLHCRGSANIDFEAVAKVPALNNMILSRASVHEFDEDEVGYGLINPFVAPTALASHASVIQIFDPSVLDGSGETGTMMTNAGDRTWAVEFAPSDVIAEHALESTHVAAVATTNYNVDCEPLQTIGILTGNAPESGALLWKKINSRVRDQRGDNFRGDVSYPRVVVHSLPQMGWSMELSNRADRLFPIIREEVQRMVNSGATLVAFACNTTQFYRPQVEDFLSTTSASYISVVESVKSWLATNSDKTVFVAAIGHVTSRSGMSAFPFLHTLPNVQLPTEHQSKLIESLAYQVKQNKVDGRTYQKFRAMVRSTNADIVLLLLTEISMIYDKYPRRFLGNAEIVDALDIFADDIAKQAITQRLSQSPS